MVNLWPNRLIGDAALLLGERFAVTIATAFTKDSPVLPSDFLGLVRFLTANQRTP